MTKRIQVTLYREVIREMDIGCDIDGTLLDYDYIPGIVKINLPLIQSLGGKRLALISNQGGLPFGVAGLRRPDGRPYPKPQDFLLRIQALLDAIDAYSITLTSLHVCVYHPKAQAKHIEQACMDLRQGLLFDQPSFVVYTESQFRKPSPLMLTLAGVSCYYGDDTTDRQAAEAAGVDFFPVERFGAAGTQGAKGAICLRFTAPPHRH